MAATAEARPAPDAGAAPAPGARPVEPAAPGVTTAWIGLGANLGDPAAALDQARHALAALPASRLIAVSPVYRSAPVGPPDQPDYLNAAARLDTALAPAALLAALHAIEARAGRVRDGARWGPRTLDLDLLLYGDRVSADPGLILPHPELHRRAFVLVPLADIAPPDLAIPGHGTLAALLTLVVPDGLAPQRLAPPAINPRPPAGVP